VRAALIRAAVVAAALAAAAPAVALDSPPAPPAPDDSAVSQYVEGVPAAAGTKAPGVGTRPKPRPLSSSIRARLKTSGGSDARVLQQLATSPDLGAVKRRPRPHRGVVRPSQERSSASGALSAAVTAAGDGGGTRFAILGLVLVAITASVLGSARRRARPLRS
jgi:hypothetical protein